MLRAVVDSSQILKLQPVQLSMGELIKVYDKSLGVTDSTEEIGEFLHFYDNWGHSNVYKIPCGFLRFEPYPHLGSATIHGMFFGNPFRDCKNIINVLNLYLGEHPEFSHLECHVSKKFRGVLKLVAPMAYSSTFRDGKWIFSFGRQ